MDVLFDVDGVLVDSRRFRQLLDTEFGISPETTRLFLYGRFNLCARGETRQLPWLRVFVERVVIVGSKRHLLAVD